jgi:hypothetical protein
MVSKIFEKYSPGVFAPSGTYLNRKTWDLMQISKGGDYLPAGQGIDYYRVPLLMVLALGPLAGLAFVLFLPLAGSAAAIYMALKVIAGKIPWQGGKQAGGETRTAR